MLPWSSSLKDKASALLQQLEADQAVHTALAQAGTEQLALLREGIRRFEDSGYTRPEPAYDVVWREGGSRLLRLPGDAPDNREPVLLFVPSLINRAYIFDLSENASMMRFLHGQGITCALLAWGDPTEVERPFSLSDYVARLLRAIEALDAPVVLAGYCMGGLMALAAAQTRPDKVKALALLATPWDFHEQDVPQLPGKELYATSFEDYLKNAPIVPGELVYQLLYAANPWPVHDKFMRFATMQPGSAAARTFLEREHWVQDGMALTTQVAHTCFIEWPVHNTTAKGQWKISGEVIRPENLKLPSFLAIARQDSVVPPRCAGALSLKLPGALTIHPPSGHVGMVVGSKAQEHLWLPLAKWLKSL